jgi:hypothetical protein
MRGFSLGAACALVVVSFFLSASRSLGESKTTESQPQALVQAALKAELAGHSAERSALLEQALALDPDFAPARWQSGFVRWDGQWLKVDEVPERARDNEQLAAYRKRRDQLIDTADNQRALAQWCHKHKLPDEERVHWAKVLEFDPRDAEAISGLGLELYNGRLLTHKQIGEEKERAGEQLRATRHWQPKLLKLRGAIERGNAKQRAAALGELTALDDPAAVPALEAVFAARSDSKKSTESNQLLIETAGHIRGPEATGVLLRQAIMADARPVRDAAIAELKKRPMHTYVPLLIAALPGSVETAYRVCLLPNGAIDGQAEVLSKRGRSEHRISYNMLIYFLQWSRLMGRFVDPYSELAVANQLLTPLQEIETAASDRGRFNERLRFALASLTGFADTDDPDIWTKNWNDFNDSYTATYWPSPPQTSESYSGVIGSLTFDYMSCFAAGTAVLTIAGPLPIETIKSGDRVLAQDTTTGELAYKTVQATTLRPATPTVNVGLGPETIRTTRGHLFWVDGRGWLTAKQLQPGMALHTLAGPEIIDRLEESPPCEAYNLVVADFGTYFVGAHRMLVHDNTPQDTDTPRVPGLDGDLTVP